MKKTWIKVKRGLLRPEHREKIGVRVWLFMYIVDRADWETGVVWGWRDKDEADDFGMPWRTLQQQRQQLEKDDYITCKLSGDHQDIYIHNWTNPREYSGDLYNGGTRDYVYPPVGTESYVPQDMGGDNLSPDGENGEGTNEGTNEGLSKPSTPTLYSHITDHTAAVFQTYEKEIGPLTPGIVDELIGDIKDYSAIWVIDSAKIARKRGKCNLSYMQGILRNWKADGKDNGEPKEQPTTQPAEVWS